MELTRLGKVANEFKTFKLKDILQKNDAGDWGDEPSENPIGIVRSTNFNNDGKFNLSEIAFRSLKPQKVKDKKLYANEILIERSGGSDTQPVGRVGLVTEEMAMQNLAFANFIQRIAIDTTIDSTFLFYCLQQMYEMGLTASMQFQTTGIRNLDWKLYTKSLLPKPPLPEQRTIAAILTRVDKAIEATEASIRAAERLKRALMQNMLTGKLKPDGTLRTEDEFYIDEKFGKVPVGWDVQKLQGLCERANDSFNPLNSESSEKYIGLEHINSGDFSINGFGQSDDTLSLKSRFTKGDILYGKLRPYLNKVWLAEFGGVCSTECLVLRSSSFLNWVYYHLQTSRFLNFTSSVTAGTQHPRAGWNDIKGFLIAVPLEKTELDAITQKISALSARKQSKQSKITKLQRLKKSLMQNLLTGRVRVDLAKLETVLDAAELVTAYRAFS